MNYAIAARSARQVVTFSRSIHFCHASGALLNNSTNRPRTSEFGQSNLQKRNFSLQATVESVIKTQSGIFRSISESTPVEYLQNFVVSLHDISGLPWWATIMCTTVFLRSAVTVPLAIYQNYIMGKVHHVHLELAELAKELKKETAVAIQLYKWDEKTAKHNYNRSLRKQYNLLIVRDNCHPVKASLLIWFQLPMWLCFSVALRNLVYMLPIADANAQATFAELTVGGFGWISNLTQTDPLFILPVALGLINLTIIEVQALSRASTPSKFQRYALNFFRGFSIFMIPITACVPSCVALYWTTSSLYGLVQNLVLMSPKVKRLCRIPQTSSELEKPYTHILNGLKRKVNSIGVSKVS